MFIPSFGWISIRPLEYGNAIRFFQNWPTYSSERSAALFRVAVPGLDDCSSEVVDQMYPRLPGALEYAICLASGLIDESEEDDEEVVEEVDPPEGGGMFSPPEEATSTLNEFNESDLIYQLCEAGNSREEINRLLLPEIDEILEGADRHAQRKDSNESTGSSSGTPVQGNRGGSHATDLFG